MQVSTVSEAISAAFALLPLPQMSLHQAQLTDQSMSREITEIEWREAAKEDAGKTWDKFTDQELILCDAALSHLDEKSFIYYLPAFLLLAIRHLAVKWNHAAWETVGSAVFAVTDRSPYSLGRFACLSSMQIEAVRLFLNHVAESTTDHAHDARIALDRYWNTEQAGRLIIGP